MSLNQSEEVYLQAQTIASLFHLILYLRGLLKEIHILYRRLPSYLIFLDAICC